VSAAPASIGSICRWNHLNYTIATMFAASIGLAPSMLERHWWHVLDEAVLPVTPEERGDRGARRESFKDVYQQAGSVLTNQRLNGSPHRRPMADYRFQRNTCAVCFPLISGFRC
jgi:hypothetical protein